MVPSGEKSIKSNQRQRKGAGLCRPMTNRIDSSLLLVANEFAPPELEPEPEWQIGTLRRRWIRLHAERSSAIAFSDYETAALCSFRATTKSKPRGASRGVAGEIRLPGIRTILSGCPRGLNFNAPRWIVNLCIINSSAFARLRNDNELVPTAGTSGARFADT